MSARARHCLYFLVFVSITLDPRAGGAQTATDTAPKTAAQTPARPDGQHDFDFLIGSWKYHLSRLEHPLTGSTKWSEFEGTGVCRPVWDGKGQLDELEVEGPTGHIEGLTLRLYNPESRQWSLNWANAKTGTLGVPTVGAFDRKNGRGEFYDQEAFNGRMILVRYVWSDITPTSARFEQSFSDDGGKTWEPNWVTTQVRVKQ